MPDEYPKSFVDSRAQDVRKATQHDANTRGYNIEETTKVTPEE